MSKRGAPAVRLERTVALVTGGSRGVGKGAAVGLGEVGATVYVTARTLEPTGAVHPGSLAETIEEIEGYGGAGRRPALRSPGRRPGAGRGRARDPGRGPH